MISNATKFSPPKASIQVSLLVEPQTEEADLISISVSDRGIGISKKELKQLFTPFFRSEDQRSKDANPNGNGLGLSIC